MRADIVPGARFPDYELPDHTGRKRKLSGLQGDAPLVLFLARGIYWMHDPMVPHILVLAPELMFVLLRARSTLGRRPGNGGARFLRSRTRPGSGPHRRPRP